MTTAPSGSVMFVANYGTDVGYAWSTIIQVYRRAGEQLAERGIPVAMSFANLDGGAIDQFTDSPVRPLEKDYMASLQSVRGCIDFARFLREHRVRVLYLTDHVSLSWRYLVYRLFGVRRIVMHERTSGERTRPGPLLGLVKRLLHRVRWITVDRFIAVSHFVAERLVRVNRVDPSRITTVHNGIDLAPFDDPDPGYLREVVDVDPERPILFFAGRARRYKGVQVAIRALAVMKRSGRRGGTPVLVVCGDGADLPDFRELAGRLAVDADTIFLGRRDDVADLLPGATVAVVPSIWAEAFGLAVVEAMAAGVPVVASRVGGIPELIDEGGTGLLVPPDDAEALADALDHIVGDTETRAAMGRRGRATAREQFDIARTVGGVADALVEQVEEADILDRESEGTHGPRTTTSA